MTAYCKDICKQYKSTFTRGTRRYAEGQKRCNSCYIFMNYDGKYCPCCGIKLRTKPKNTKFKTILNEILRSRT